MGHLMAYIEQYGYIVLFGALLLELIAFPFPGEVLMTYSGFLVFQHELNWTYCILVAGAGTSLGMTISYLIGYKLGAPFFAKYGHHFHMGPEKINKTSHWFNKYGSKLLLIAYFIPGIRHITGYFSGIIRMSFRKYALYAYSGAFIWASLFITLGKILGPQWEQFHVSVSKYLLIASVIAIVILAVLYLHKKHKQDIKNLAIQLLGLALDIFRSRKKVGLLLIITATITLGLSLLMMGLIQDFLGNEFHDFNEITRLLIHFTFSGDWKETMVLFSFMGSRNVLIPLLVLTVMWLLWKGRDKSLEFTLLVIVSGGGELYEESLRRIFHHFSPTEQSFANQMYSFPSEQSLMTLVIYGIMVFLIVRTIKNVTLRTLVPLSALILVILIAIGRLYLEKELPSDIAAGYVFGGVWLGFSLLIYEVLLILRNLNFVPRELLKKQN